MNQSNVHISFLKGALSAEGYASALQHAIESGDVDTFFNSFSNSTTAVAKPEPVFSSYTYYVFFDRWLIGELSDDGFVAEFKNALTRGDVKTWFEVWDKMKLAGLFS